MLRVANTVLDQRSVLSNFSYFFWDTLEIDIFIKDLLQSIGCLLNELTYHRLYYTTENFNMPTCCFGLTEWMLNQICFVLFIIVAFNSKHNVTNLIIQISLNMHA